MGADNKVARTLRFLEAYRISFATLALPELTTLKPEIAMWRGSHCQTLTGKLLMQFSLLAHHSLPWFHYRLRSAS